MAKRKRPTMPVINISSFIVAVVTLFLAFATFIVGSIAWYYCLFVSVTCFLIFFYDVMKKGKELGLKK